jgi:hypothetical protein
MIAPKHGAIIELPEILDPLRSARFIRIHSDVIKECLKQELLEHHRRRIPQHFTPAARFRYGYARRAPSTVAKKRRQGKPPIDLLDSGETYRSMTRQFEELRVGGSFMRSGQTRNQKGIRATMVLRWPFPISDTDMNPGGVSVTQMAQELEAFTEDEERQISQSLKARYVQKINQRLKHGSRIRKRIVASGGLGG